MNWSSIQQWPTNKLSNFCLIFFLSFNFGKTSYQIILQMISNETEGMNTQKKRKKIVINNNDPQYPSVFVYYVCECKILKLGEIKKEKKKIVKLFKVDLFVCLFLTRTCMIIYCFLIERSTKYRTMNLHD